MQKPLRVLQINSGSNNFGGVSSFLYNIYIHIDKSQIQFDFLSPEKTTYGIHRSEIEQMGGKIFELGITGNILTRKIKLYFKLKAFLKKNNYRIVHINSGNFFFNVFVSFAIKNAGVPVRIIHSHNAGDTNKSKLKKIAFNLLKPVLNRNATDLFACSMLAADYMFTEKTVKSGKVKIIPNGIDTSKFAYNESVRNQVRSRLGLNDKFVVGNVARFMPQKNHAFLIDVFEKVAEKNDKAVLVLIGQGELMDNVKALVAKKGLSEKVIFLGQRNDVDKLYQAMDVFVLTSFHEGFGIVTIEAQSSGLPCIISDNIPEEANVTKTMIRLPLSCSAKKWADTILKSECKVRKNNAGKVSDAGYDVKSVSDMMKRFYINS